MLCQFSVQNFKSYKDTACIDFQAIPSILEFDTTLIKTPNASPLLPVNVIYGPNAGGKSNILEAISCLVEIIVRPVEDLKKNKQEIIIQNNNIDIVPYLFDKDKKDEPTLFDIFIRIDEYEYNYGLEIKNNEVISEYLFRKKVTSRKRALLFTREKNEITLGYSMDKNVNKKINNKMPYLSFLAINYNIEQIDKVMSWFENCITLSYTSEKIEKKIYINSKFDKKLFIKMLNSLGINIIDFKYDKENKKFITTHNINNIPYELSFDKESDGTQKLMTVIPAFLLALKEGRMLIIDDLDAKLHPKLLQYMIKIFKSKVYNKYGAQLLFTSHDIFTLKKTVFRRDEIWFAEQKRDSSSHIYSLSEIRENNTCKDKNQEAYDKQYIEGRYGADPYLSILTSEEFS